MADADSRRSAEAVPHAQLLLSLDLLSVNGVG